MTTPPRPLPHQSQAAGRLGQLFLQSPAPTLCLITGPSGSGKTWLALHALQAIEVLGDSPPPLVVQGQQTLQATPLACWRLALHGRRSRFNRPAAYRQITDEAMRATSKISLGLSELVSVAIGARKKFRAAPATLSDEQFAVLHDVAGLAADSGPFLLLLDDLQWMDEQSVEIVRALFLPAFEEAIPFVSRTRVAAVLRSDVPSAAVVERFLHDLRPPVVQLSLPDPDAADSAMKAFGLRKLEADVMEALYAATGGHLQLLRELGNHITSARTMAGVSGGLLATHSDDWLALLRESLRDRLSKAEVAAGVLHPVEFLESAATIGVVFTEAALRCITVGTETDCARALSMLTALGILQRNGPVIRFSHEVLQGAAAPSETIRQRLLHERYAECLRLLSPADYDARSFHLDRAGQTEEAHTMALLGMLAGLRQGTERVARPSPGDNPSPANAGALLERATRAWLANDYAGVVDLLHHFPSDPPELLAAERAYLVADSLLKSIEARDRQAVADILDEWRPKVAGEFELWFRLSTTLMITHSHASDLTAARTVEREIATAVDKRRQFDPSAISYAYTLYRKSDALHEPEVVVRRQQEALRYFRGDLSGGTPRSPAEYSRTAANLVGTYVVLGEYASAESVADELMAWIAGTPIGVLPRATVALNNVLLTRLMAGTASADEVLSAFEDLSAAAMRAEDRLLIASNLAAVQVRAGDLSSATATLQACDDVLGRLYQPDAYYVYFVRSNLIACQFHAGTLPDPVLSWRGLSDALAVIHEPIRPYCKLRHELLEAAFAEVAPGDTRAWDDFPQQKFPRKLGRSWAFYGRGFLLTDIQHWSDG